MTQYQLLKTNQSLLRIMRSNGMKVKDVELAEIVAEADEMVARGEQKSYVVQYLSEKFDVSVRTIYSAIDRLHSEIML